MKTTQLTCGCCGAYFKTWPEYTDQDQDRGFGICAPCQGINELRNVEETTKSINLLAERLNEPNRTKFLAYARHIQEYLVECAFRDGILKWTIAGK